MSYAELCYCGHDKATHFEAKHTCLGMRCDCEKYTHQDDPLPVKPAVRPTHHPPWCKCFACKAAPPAPKPVHVDDDWGPVTHPFWCVCPICFPQGASP